MTDVNSKSGEILSSISNFTSSRSPSPINIKNVSSSLKAATAAAMSVAMPNGDMSSSSTSSDMSASSSGISLFNYILIFFVLGVLGLTLFLYLEKPKEKGIEHLFDPVFDFFGMGITQKLVEPPKKNKENIDKLEKVLNEKKIVNNIDKENTESASASSLTKKKPSSMPKPSDYNVQMAKPKSKSGFCYIGENSGARSCIEVGEGDVCMSGDIFPSQEICINPNLRE
jgi:hypothetical protein